MTGNAVEARWHGERGAAAGGAEDGERPADGEDAAVAALAVIVAVVAAAVAVAASAVSVAVVDQRQRPAEAHGPRGQLQP